MSLPQNIDISRQSETGASARSLLWMGAAAILGFVALLWLLSWVSGFIGVAQDSGPGLDAKTGTIRLVASQEPPQLDSTRTTDTMSAFVLGHILEGLLRFDEHNRLAPAVAERWEIRPDGATFYLRSNARWSDGRPVTAGDFVFAWRLVVDPANAAQYSYLMYPLKNAEAINTGKLPPEMLGVRAEGDSVLEVTFERPVPYFDKLVTFVTFLPIRKDFYESRNGRYAADAADLLFNGPFSLAKWVHGAQVRMERNPEYWDNGRTHLNVIDIPYITSDTNTMLNLFGDRKAAFLPTSVGLGAEPLKRALIEGWPIHQMRDGSVWYVEFNHRQGNVTANRNFRKALQLVSDNDELVYRAIKVAGWIPADSIFPVWLNGEKGLFRQEHPAPKVKVDVAAARRHLDLAKAELGIDAWPPVTLLIDNTETVGKMAEYYQRVYKEQLGIELRIDRQIFKQRIAKMEAGDFEMALYGWSPDYDDPMTFGDLHASWNPNNHGRYNNPELDRQVEIAQNSLDPKTRMEAFASIQDIVITEAVVIPNYERGQLYIQDSRLRGVVRRAIGTDPDFTNAYIVPN